MLNFSVIICTYNRKHLLERCFDSWSKSTRLPDQFLVVDASVDASSYSNKLVTQFPSLFSHPDSHFIVTKTPGTSAQRNIGMKYLNTDIVCFADDDTFIKPDYVEKILDIFNQDHHEIIGGINGVAEGQFDNYKERYFRLAKNFMRHNLGSLVQRIRIPKEHTKLYEPIPSYLQKYPLINIDRLWGANMNFRTKLIHNDSFDETFKKYGLFEDVEFSARVGKTHKLVCRLDAEIEHDDSLGQSTRPSDIKYFLISWLNSTYIIEKLFPYQESRNAHKRLFDLISFIPKIMSQEFCNSKLRTFGNKELRAIALSHIKTLKNCQNQADLEQTFVHLQDEVFSLAQ